MPISHYILLGTDHIDTTATIFTNTTYISGVSYLPVNDFWSLPIDGQAYVRTAFMRVNTWDQVGQSNMLPVHLLCIMHITSLFEGPRNGDMFERCVYIRARVVCVCFWLTDVCVLLKYTMPISRRLSDVYLL